MDTNTIGGLRRKCFHETITLPTDEEDEEEEEYNNNNNHITLDIPHGYLYNLQTNEINQKNIKYIITKETIKTTLRVVADVAAIFVVYTLCGINIKS